MDEKKVKEAIEFLQRKIRTLDAQKEYDEYCNPVHNETLDLAIGLYETAIEALEKQLPKKTRENGMQDGLIRKIKYYTCPTCGNCLLTEMMNERQNTGYCWDCGQRLDWSYQTEVAGNIFDDPELLEVE